MITCDRCGHTTEDEHSFITENWGNLYDTRMLDLCGECQQDYFKIEGEWDRLMKGFWNEKKTTETGNCYEKVGLAGIKMQT